MSEVKQLRLFQATESLGLVLQRYRGLGPGFDFLRLALAVSIVAFHATIFTGNAWLRASPLWFAEYAGVPMFFCLSGFLVAGSAGRLSIRNFLINRGLRIIPGLGGDILISAVIIGPLFTTLPISKYFTNPEFYRYLLNITGVIHYSLPGVFKGHVDSSVNGSLWTVPYELICYVIVSGLILRRWLSKPLYVAVMAVSFYLIGLFIEKNLNLFSPQLQQTLQFLFVYRGAKVLLAFMTGILVFQLRSHIPYSYTLFGICCALCITAAFVLHQGSMDSVANRAVLVPALTYVTVFVGLTPLKLPSFLRRGDYSYGIYLYHDPVLQALISLAPGLFLASKFGNIILFVFGLPAVGLLASFSWHFIERPILGLRKRFSFVAKVRGVALSTEPSVGPLPILQDREASVAGLRREAVPSEVRQDVGSPPADAALAAAG